MTGQRKELVPYRPHQLVLRINYQHPTRGIEDYELVQLSVDPLMVTDLLWAYDQLEDSTSMINAIERQKRLAWVEEAIQKIVDRGLIIRTDAGITHVPAHRITGTVITIVDL